MSFHQMTLEYVLVYCTSYGLTTLGEPALPKTSQPVGDSVRSVSSNQQKPMPVWIISIFLLLVTAKYLLSFFAWYVFQVISTVVIVATKDIKTLDAAIAKGHEDSPRARLERLARQIRILGAFKTAKADRLRLAEETERLRQVSVAEIKQELKRRATMREDNPPSAPIPSTRSVWTRVTAMPCFRGFSALLIMSVAQWYLAAIIDFVLSGQPSDFKLGYGTTSIVLQTIFGSGYAVWTHYTITKPTNKHIFEHFPRGEKVLIELWPITALWAVTDHLSLSGPLALSRWLELKRFAFDPNSWNDLDEAGQQKKILQFALVFLLHVILVAFVSVPVTMVTRRVYASMLSDEDLAIVPFERGQRNSPRKFDERSKYRRPGLMVHEAWATVSWTSYFRALRIYLQYFLVFHLIHLTYWSINWRLHEVFEIEKYASAHLPCSPIAVVKPFDVRNTTVWDHGVNFSHSEL